MSTKEKDATAYVPIFNQHLRETQKHLQVGISSSAQTETQVICSVLWTSTELDSFFHALKIYSRLRPDLISACIKTKNVLDVIDYLELLEEGSKHFGHLSDEKTPFAYEMSRSWISWEEAQAELLRARETTSTTSIQNQEHNDLQPLLTRSTTCKDIEKRSEISPMCEEMFHRPFAWADSNHQSRSETEVENRETREPSLLSRRRFQKRMCMRRRRARERGKEVNLSTPLLKPGPRSAASKASLRKVKATSSTSAPWAPSLAVQRRNSVADRQSEEQASPRTISSPPTSEAKFIHVPNLRNFLRFHVGLYDKNLLTGHEDIEPDVIDILTRMTQDFVSDVIYRVVVLSEARRRMRGSTKVWHQDEGDAGTLGQSIIQQCLDSIGFGMRTRKQSFQDRLTSFDIRHENGSSLMRDKDDIAVPIPYEYLPRSLGNCTEIIDWSLYDQGHDHSNSEEVQDREDSLADWVHEVDSWNQVDKASVFDGPNSM